MVDNHAQWHAMVTPVFSLPDLLRQLRFCYQQQQQQQQQQQTSEVTAILATL